MLAFVLIIFGSLFVAWLLYFVSGALGLGVRAIHEIKRQRPHLSYWQIVFGPRPYPPAPR